MRKNKRTAKGLTQVIANAQDVATARVVLQRLYLRIKGRTVERNLEAQFNDQALNDMSAFCTYALDDVEIVRENDPSVVVHLEPGADKERAKRVILEALQNAGY